MEGVKAMSPAEITAATSQLITAVEDRAIQSGVQTEARQGQLAPGLQTGSNLEGGYNYQRVVAPIVDPLTASLTTDAKRQILRQALTDAAYTAQSNYDLEQRNYSRRYREFQREQARRSRNRQSQSDAIAQSQLNALQNNSGTPGVGGVDVNSTSQYIGNNDYRGRLYWLAQNGPQNIRGIATTALKYVGNDGKYKLNPGDPNNASAISALNAIGAVNTWAAPAATQNNAPQVNPTQPRQLINQNDLLL